MLYIKNNNKLVDLSGLKRTKLVATLTSNSLLTECTLLGYEDTTVATTWLSSRFLMGGDCKGKTAEYDGVIIIEPIFNGSNGSHIGITAWVNDQVKDAIYCSKPASAYGDVTPLSISFNAGDVIKLRYYAYGSANDLKYTEYRREPY